MTSQDTHDYWQQPIAFTRLHALASRGYRPVLGADQGSAGAIKMRHPSTDNQNNPPNITLWYDGTVATPNLLWPSKYVPTEDGSPDWQRFITPSDEDGFYSFAQSIKRPKAWVSAINAISRLVRPVYAKAILASAICISFVVITKEIANTFV